MLLFSRENARAESTICRDGHLAVTGQRIYEVFLNCGKPSWWRHYGF